MWEEHSPLVAVLAVVAFLAGDTALACLVADSLVVGGTVALQWAGQGDIALACLVEGSLVWEAHSPLVAVLASLLAFLVVEHSPLALLVVVDKMGMLVVEEDIVPLEEGNHLVEVGIVQM